MTLEYPDRLSMRSRKCIWKVERVKETTTRPKSRKHLRDPNDPPTQQENSKPRGGFQLAP